MKNAIQCEADLPWSLLALARTYLGRFVVFGLPYIILGLGDWRKALGQVIDSNNRRLLYLSLGMSNPSIIIQC